MGFSETAAPRRLSAGLPDLPFGLLGRRGPLPPPPSSGSRREGPFSPPGGGFHFLSRSSNLSRWEVGTSSGTAVQSLKEKNLSL